MMEEREMKKENQFATKMADDFVFFVLNLLSTIKEKKKLK